MSTWEPRKATTASYNFSSGKKTAAHPLMDVEEGSKSSDVNGFYGSKSAAESAFQSPTSQSPTSRGVAPLPTQDVEAVMVRTRNDTKLNRNEVKKHVLTTYTANVPIVSLVTEEGETLTDEQKHQMKLNQIDVDSTAKANQSDLVKHIEGLDADLKAHWGRGEKVKGLRIAIQATKMLNNPRAPHCYPSVFILVASVLDTFGNFVADRLQDTAAGKSFVIASLLKRGQEAGADIIPPEAVEMCNNWFLKIASIRELLPRICIELSLIKCYKYVSKKVRVNMSTTVERLALQIRGIADPLVSNHIRWYLFLRAAEVLRKTPHWATHLEQCCLDGITVLGQLTGTVYEATLRDRGITHQEYLCLFIPALQWMLDTVVKYGNPDTRLEFAKKAFEATFKLDFNSAALVYPLLKAFPAEDILAITPASELMALIAEQRPVPAYGISRLKLVETFAFALSEVQQTAQLNMSRSERTELLKEMWAYVEEDGAAAGVNVFLSSAGAVLQYCASHMGLKQVNLVLGASRKMLEQSSEDANDAVLSLLGGIVTRLDVSSLLTSSHFLPLVKYLSPQSRRNLTVKTLDLVPTDASYGAATMELCKILHSVLPPATQALEMERCSKSICSALRRVFNTDPEAELRMLSDARHSLTEIDAVRQLVISEAIKLVHLFGGNPKKRQAAKGCLAFCHVTVPAVMRPLARVRAALGPATIAFQYGFVAQGEALLHLCIQTLKEVPPTYNDVTTGLVASNDLEIIETVLQLISIAAVVPSHAKYGHGYVANAVLNWNRTFPWLATSVGQLTIYSAIVRAMVRACIGELDYGFPKCGTTRYHNDEEFVEACRNIACEAATRGLEQLEDMLQEHQADPTKYPKIAQMAVELFETCCYFGDSESGEEGSAVVFQAARLTFSIMSNCVDATDISFMRRVRNIAESSKELLGEELFAQITKPPKKRKAKKEKPAEKEPQGEDGDVDALLAEAEGTPAAAPEPEADVDAALAELEATESAAPSPAVEEEQQEKIADDEI